MADIDSLSIEISASTKSAASALDTLISKLGTLESALGRMSTGGFSTQINSAADALTNLGYAAQGIDAARITSVARGLTSLSDAGAKLASVGEGAAALSQVASGLSNLSSAAAAIPDADAITHLAGAIKMLGGEAATNASFVLQPIADALRAFEGIVIPDVQGLTNLAYALRSMGSKHVSTAAAELPIVANALRSFQDITVPDVTGISELATAIGQLGRASVAKAATNIPAVATAFRTLLTELSNVPQVSRQTVDLANALGQLAQGSNRVNTMLNSAKGGFTSYSTHANRARLSTLSLTAAIAKLRAIFFALRRVFNFVRDGMKYYSDLVEVQNVVDVTFGQMASKMEALTNTSIKTLGMSELTAKQIGARFQAMGSAMGITQQQVGDASAYLADKVHTSYAGIYNDMSDVSINLTKLAADMASFYNVEQADVAKDLESVFTGMTRPLRKYGLDLTQATLKEWAMKNGMDADIQSMTQAEKTMLRYQYVMANSTNAMGDFARTADTWANSVRVLKQTLQQLGGTLGKAFVNLLKPAVQGLTRFFNTLISLVEKAVNAIGKLLGWQIRIDPVGANFEEDAEGAAGALDDAAGGAGGTAKGLDDAADAAKKLNKQLMAYDEINNIKLPDEDEDTSGSGSPGGGGGGGGASGGGAGEGGAATGGGVTWKKYESDIDTWFEFGRRISDTITEALNSIDWDSIQAKSRRFGENLGHFLNGLITPDMFYAVGRTIAEGGNTIVYFLQELGHTFDAVNFGESLAAGVSGFFENFDFVAFGDTVNTWADNILTTVITFIKKTPWSLIGQKIGEFLKEIDFLETGKKIAIALYEAINAGFELYGSMLRTAPIETALATLGGIGLFALTHKKSIKTLADHINNAVTGTQNFLDLVQLAATDSDGRFVGFGQTLANLGQFMSPLAKTVTGIATGLGEFFLVKDGVSTIIEALRDNETPWSEKWKTYAAAIGEVTAAIGLGLVGFTLVFGVPGGLIATGLVAAAGAWVAYRENIEKTINEETMKSVGEALLHPGGISIEDLSTAYIEHFDAVKQSFDDVSAAAEGLAGSKSTIEDISRKIDTVRFAMDNGASTTKSKCTEIKGYFDDLLAHTETVMNQEYNTIVTGLAGSMGVALEAAGVSVPSVIATLDKISNYQETGLEGIQTQVEANAAALEAGEISAEEYRKRMMELDAEYRELMRGTIAFSDETRALDGAIKDATVDFGSLVQTTTDANGNITVTGINTNELTANIDAVSQAYSDAKTSISGAYNDYVSAMQSQVDWAKEHPDVISADEVSDLETSINESITAQETNLANLTATLDQFTNTLTSGAFEKIPSIIEEAEKKWENLDPDIQSEVDRGEFVQKALDDYYEKVIVPLQDGLDQMYEGVSGKEAPNIAETIKGFMSNAFGEGYGIDAMGAFTDIISYDDWESVYDEYKDGGKYLVEGVTDGVNENAENAAQATSDMFDAQLKAYNAEAGINSPSRVMMLASQYLVEGAVKGIKEHQNDFINAMKDMASDGINAFKKALQDGINNAVGNLKVPKVSVSSSGGMSGVMEGQMSAASSAVDTSMQEMFTDVLPQYFEAGQWDGLFATLSSTLDIGLEGIAGSFDTWMTGFWNEHLTVWFEDSKLKEGIFTPLETNLTDEWTSLTTWFDTSMNKWWDEDLTPWFAADKWEPQFDTINTAADTGFQKVRRTIGDLLDKITDDVKKSCKKMGDDLKDISDSLRDTKELSNISVTVDAKGARSYATGGFVEDGYFFANHNEMVGRFSNGRTAVANNAQIVAGIQAGVYAAVRDAMNDSGGTQVVIQGDTDRIFRVMQNKSRQYNRATGANAFA